MALRKWEILFWCGRDGFYHQGTKTQRLKGEEIAIIRYEKPVARIFPRRADRTDAVANAERGGCATSLGILDRP
jgi:hypothetical protein